MPGINEEGLFRVNGNVRIVERLRASFEQSGDVVLDATRTDVMSVATLLKLFLRELPEGVVPQADTKRFVHAHQSQYLSGFYFCYFMTVQLDFFLLINTVFTVDRIS